MDGDKYQRGRLGDPVFMHAYVMYSITNMTLINGSILKYFRSHTHTHAREQPGREVHTDQRTRAIWLTQYFQRRLVSYWIIWVCRVLCMRLFHFQQDSLRYRVT